MDNLKLSGEIAEILREASALMNLPFEVTSKEGFSNIVTSSDIAVQNFLCDRLSRLVPGSGFLCEEGEAGDGGYEWTWVIDPIDGTTNFVRGMDACAISVGLRHRSEISSAAVYLPRTDEMFTADKGSGAMRNGKPIRVSERSFADSVMFTALPVYHKENAAVCSEILLDTFMQCNDIRRFGAAAAELCYLACGRCELYFEFFLCPWDYAAASLILAEAGGAISDLEGRTLPLDQSSGVVAANKKDNLGHLLGIVRSHLQD